MLHIPYLTVEYQQGYLWSIEGEAVVEEDVGEDKLDEHQKDVEHLDEDCNKGWDNDEEKT